MRARRTGILDLDARLGQRVADGKRLGPLVDSLGRTLRLVHANRDGIVIGRTEAPLVDSGDAILHIAHESRPAGRLTQRRCGSRHEIRAREHGHRCIGRPQRVVAERTEGHGDTGGGALDVRGTLLE